MTEMIKRGGRWVRKNPSGNYDYPLNLDHHLLARKLEINHGEAVMLARTFCLSGNKAGEHGRLCPCDPCTTRAVLILNGKKKDNENSVSK